MIQNSLAKDGYVDVIFYFSDFCTKIFEQLSKHVYIEATTYYVEACRDRL